MPRNLASPRRLRVLAGVAALAVASTGAAYAANLTAPGGTNRHHGDQTAEVDAQIKYGKAKNVILFIGDGMGDSEITIARNYLAGAAGTLKGIDSLPLTGQYTTYALHKKDDPLSPGDDTGKPDYVTDSAASGTGWATGVKSYNGAISVGLDGTTTHQTLLEWAKTRGLKTGDVTTAEIQDATPAVQYAHVADRGCYTPAGQTVTVDGRSQKKDTTNCPGQTSIEEQLLAARPDVTLGGGRGWFDAVAGNGRSVLQNAEDSGFQVVEDKGTLTGVRSADQRKPLLGLFASGNMQTRYKATPATATGYSKPAATCRTNDTAPDGSAVTWPGTQPTLADMTDKAIKLLDNKKGFFLQVEGASIDKQDHAANACGQIGETQDLDEAVQVGMEFAKKHGDTLVLVTADHAHTSQIINAADISAASPSTIPLAGTYNLLTHDGTTMTVAYGTAQLNGSQQHTGTQLRLAGYGPGAANVVGLSDQTDMFNTIKGALSGSGLDRGHGGGRHRH
ncbi:alkaline phosphatase [Nocardioides sp. CER19]|uniref:alkaline phosphatase n=1 Tax=Nocardioides sp. CER19 TaxID=3038538 RepID=UPI0024480923|nr:alkaline phosphatase [Nocardioides sp. CER19]MDH2416875.1 alkaline phosphatase [Nocardioides sp. CER19]